MQYKIVLKKMSGIAEIAKIFRRCGRCNKKYEVEIMRGDYHWPSFLECTSCGISLRYSEDLAYPYLKNDPKLTTQQIKRQIESKIPLCPKCNGKFKNVDGSRYGVPTYCPYCKVSQEAINSPHPSPIDKSKIRYVSEDVYWLEVVKDGEEQK